MGTVPQWLKRETEGWLKGGADQANRRWENWESENTSKELTFMTLCGLLAKAGGVM